MTIGPDKLEALVAKEEIRDLAMLYSRGIDRKDIALLRSLYTSDGTDHHGDFFQGSASDFVDFLAATLPNLRYTGHHICNHLISVQGGDAEGEVYALAYHILPDDNGGFIEDLQLVRYIDRYRIQDGCWRFARRVVSFDLHNTRPITDVEATMPDPASDASYETLAHRLFSRGARDASKNLAVAT